MADVQYYKSSLVGQTLMPLPPLGKKEGLGALAVLWGSGGMQSMKNPHDLSRKEFNCRLMLRLHFFNLIPTATCASFSLICRNIYIRFWRPWLELVVMKWIYYLRVCYWSAVKWAWKARYAYDYELQQYNHYTFRFCIISKFVKKQWESIKAKTFPTSPWEENENIYSLQEGKDCPPLFCTCSFVINALHNTSQNFFQRFHIAATTQLTNWGTVESYH